MDAPSACLRRGEGRNLRRGAAQLGSPQTPERKQKAGDQPEDAAESILAGVSHAIPALLEALKLSNRAAHVGFDWPEIDGLFDKLHEEVEELKSEIKRIPPPGPLPIGRGIAGAASRYCRKS